MESEQRDHRSTESLKKQVKDVIKSLGIVFGDIGTSPIYALSVIFLFIAPSSENIFGVLSLIFWTLTSVVTLEYAWLAMSLGKKGEGGTIVLKELLTPLLSSPKQAMVVTILTFIAISLFFGDGVITPAVGILSAVEGALLIPAFAQVSRTVLVVAACAITTMLFLLQKRGAERVSHAFGPLMLLWFSALSISGMYSIVQHPSILYALNPYYALQFFIHNGIVGFFTLSAIFLCATGGEALYADMGHLGRMPIIRAWCVVFVALTLTYLGQGAFLLSSPDAKYVLYEMILHQFSAAYIPFLILSLVSTIAASQAMISGIFSIVYQGIITNVIPTIKIAYTSSKLRSQVYIGFINWCLYIAVILVIIQFRFSYKLTAFYGFAVTGTMTMTGTMMTWIFWLRKNYFKSCLAFLLTLINIVFLLASTYKIPKGGYWSILIGLIPFTILLIYNRGEQKLYDVSEFTSLEDYLEKYNEEYQKHQHLDGCALFFAPDVDRLQPYVAQTMFVNGIMYEENIIVSVVTRDDPFGVISFFKGTLAPGLQVFEIHRGYMEVLDIEKILVNAGINSKVIFYGIEAVATKSWLWKMYAIIKHMSPSFVQFYKLPANKLHGVVTRVDL
ncbi:MAG: KUP/HAK/KT family potassium transporter [Epsilonproteobacteria bacterium]|nr:KUP/HAK/KT family potassium transporter [Campylobacterota bacterium]